MKVWTGIVMSVMACVSVANSQDPTHVNGRFMVDSAALGQVIPYSLTAQYPKGQQVLFPDSTFSFAPFEIVSKKFFSTKTNGATSYDSAVYFLTPFEINRVQGLSLPVFVLQRLDCVAVYPLADSIGIQFRVAHVPDTVSAQQLPLKINTAYQRVKWILNYPMAILSAIVVVILAVAGWLIFGKRVRRYFQLRRLNRNYQEFLDRFGLLVDKLAGGFDRRRAEDALVIWKRYMEDLEAFPYTKSTSREIQRKNADSKLHHALRSIDRGIYGGLASSAEPFQFLLSFSQQQFQKREAELKNG